MKWDKAIPQIVDWYTRDCINDEGEDSAEPMYHLYSLAKERGFYAHNFKGNIVRRDRIESTNRILDLKTLTEYGIDPWDERFWVFEDLDWNENIPHLFWQGLLEEVFVKTGELYAKKDLRLKWSQHPPIELPKPNPTDLAKVVAWMEERPDSNITKAWRSPDKEPIPDYLTLRAIEPQLQFFIWARDTGESYDTSILPILHIVPNWYYDGAFWGDNWPNKEQQIYIPVMLRAKPFKVDAPRPGRPRALVTPGKNYMFKRGNVLRWNYPVILSEIYRKTGHALTRAELILPKISDTATTQGGFEIVG